MIITPQDVDQTGWLDLITYITVGTLKEVTRSEFHTIVL